jgi:phage baseplate assembly protein gpV
LIRLGQISSIDYEKGVAAIVCPDLNPEEYVTADFAFLADEINAPNVRDWVVVLFRDDGVENGYILRRYWSNKYKPPKGFKGLFFKWFSRAFDRCFLQYTDPDNNDGDNDGTLLLHNQDKIRVECGDLEIAADAALKIKGGTITIEAPNGSISFDTGDISAALVSLTNHTHLAGTLANAGGAVLGVTGAPIPTGGA